MTISAQPGRASGRLAVAAMREAAIALEPDRYIAATLAPREIGPALASIAAFAAELARIPLSVSEPMLGSIKLQWWRDALSSVREGETSGHPVADAFGECLRQYSLDMGMIETMIEAREIDLAGALPSDDAGLFSYLEAVEAHPFRLALAVAGMDREAASILASSAGRAYGIARALGRLPMLLHNGGLPLPADRLRRSGIDPDRLAAEQGTDRVVRAVLEVAGDLEALAREAHASSVRSLKGQSRAVRAALLPLAMVEPYFRAQSAGPRLDRMDDVTALVRLMRLGLAYVTGRC